MFGISIAIDNSVVAVGATGYGDDNNAALGTAYIFDISDSKNPVQQFKLLPSDGAASDNFGNAIAIDNGIVAVGAYADDSLYGVNAGSAYLFDSTTGVQIVKILPNDGAANDQFGNSIAMDNGIVAVGANYDDDNGGGSGSAYLFDAITGSQLHKLLPSDGSASDVFGFSIAIDNGIVAVGARRDADNGPNSGSAYLFNAFTGVPITKLLPSDGAEQDLFGTSIAIDDGIVAAGAYQDEEKGIESGSAYVFDAGDAPINCIWDLNNDDTVGTGDLLVLFAFWGEVDAFPEADLDGDGNVGTSDLLILLANWGPCP